MLYYDNFFSPCALDKFVHEKGWEGNDDLYIHKNMKS